MAGIGTFEIILKTTKRAKIKRILFLNSGRLKICRILFNQVLGFRF